MNDRLSFSTAISGVFNARTELAGEVLPADEHHSSGLRSPRCFAERLYFEPFVSFRLNGPGDAVMFGLNLPYTFGLRR